MRLKDYISSMDRGELCSMALKMGITSSFLSQMASGYTRIPASRALSIEIITNGKVTRKEMLPDSWRKFWLEDELEYTARKYREVEQR
ncbi:helix-turn-helix domain-containing protein [Salmonella enterica subsp. diarizonae serovar 16:z10:e,n,x,z15]|uniref:Helix-turn-helix domain-containing protein n=1 Tax=Salmonella enterica TaxID=28901 RepID=A0A7U5YQH4_SALER|nr:YdaS family helix-turn-helix protein [Salmonella enterica]ECJ2402513.1 helix-turn-helix domain-containing protein [Salmonella enterica subsp. diarizonae]EEM3070967.1 hypothetical protein [Salmonella enterica subsp. enterica serovar Java]MCH5482599.1 helix-turn-helix domain-containing protein [Salmonella enterica subsp. diarizonae serovar 16:z10:e,n,x,z15]AXD71526.1 hypothetical protein CHC34_11515 [Salmonella enterica]ECP4386477.1 helix-turn-helix domain-containing protein [Salmonella enter